MSWGNPENTIEYLKASLLSPAAAVYSLANTVDRLSYDYGFRQKYKLPCPVISVGNITCGGTGKTPIVIALTRHLLDRGLKVCVLSRGYRRLSKTEMVVVSDGKGNFASLHESGDEPFIIAKAAEKAVVMSGTNRYRTGLEALKRFGCDVFVLDDGYQHYLLARDFDIVLIDYNDEPRKDSLLPSGRLREPLASLSRASQVVITKVPDSFEQRRMDELELLIRSQTSQVDIASCRFPAKRLHGFVDGRAQGFPLSLLNGLKVVAFCGLARPENFLSEVQSLGATVVASRIFPDHHWYSAQDLDGLRAELTRSSATYLITTEKDFVKVQNSALKSNILAVELETEWLTGFPKKIEQFMEKIFANQAYLQLSEMGAS